MRRALKRAEKVEPLSRNERAVLAEYEGVIAKSKESFFRVGFALQYIRDNRLYREHARSFEAYLESRWGFQRRYANYLIEAAEAGKKLGTIVPKNGRNVMVEPVRETQVRPLKHLSDEDRKEAWDRAVHRAGGMQPAEKIVRAVVAEMRPETKRLGTFNRTHTAIVRRAIGVLRMIKTPSENIKAAIDLLSTELDGGLSGNQSND